MLAASVGDRPASLLLDTGAGLSVLDDMWAGALPLRRVEQPVEVRGTGQLPATLAVAPTIRLGAAELHEPTVVLLSLDGVSRAKGREVHGVLGFDFLSRYVVEIDYAARELRLYEPSAFGYRGPGAVVPVSLDLGVPVADVTLKAPDRTPVAARLILDIGASTLSVALSPTLAAANPAALGGLPGYAAPLGTGVGELALGRLTRLEALWLANLRFPGPTAGIAQRGQGVFALFDGAVGVPVLGQTTLIVDYARRRVILEPAGPLTAPRHDASGLHLTGGGGDGQAMVISHVAAASPAAEAGLCAGDEIEAVDGRPVSTASLDEIRALLRRDGDELTLAVGPEGGTRLVRIALRRML
jgi:PDZ domain/Aspartyl protease